MAASLRSLSFGCFLVLWNCCSSLSPRARLAGAVRTTVARFATGAALAAKFAWVLLAETLFVALLVFSNGFIDLLADSGRHSARHLQHAYVKSLFTDPLLVLTSYKSTKNLLVHAICVSRTDAALHGSASPSACRVNSTKQCRVGWHLQCGTWNFLSDNLRALEQPDGSGELLQNV